VARSQGSNGSSAHNGAADAGLNAETVRMQLPEVRRRRDGRVASRYGSHNGIEGDEKFRNKEFRTAKAQSFAAAGEDSFPSQGRAARQASNDWLLTDGLPEDFVRRLCYPVS
jgi:hypothetical protein